MTFSIKIIIAVVTIVAGSSSTVMANELDCKDCDRFAIIDETSSVFFELSSTIEDCSATGGEVLCNGCNKKNKKFSISLREQVKAKKQFEEKLAKHAMDSFQNNILALATDIAKYEMSETTMSEAAAKACTLDRITDELQQSCKGSANYNTITKHAFGDGGLSGLKTRMQGEFANILSYTIPSCKERRLGVRERISLEDTTCKDEKVCISDLESFKMQSLLSDTYYHDFAEGVSKHKVELLNAFKNNPSISVDDAINSLGRRSGRAFRRYFNDLESLNAIRNDSKSFKELLVLVDKVDLSNRSATISQFKDFLSSKGTQGLEAKCNKIYESFKNILCSDSDLKVTTNGYVLNAMRKDPDGDIDKIAGNNLYETAFCSNVESKADTKEIDDSLEFLRSVLPIGYKGDLDKAAKETYWGAKENNFNCPRLALWDNSKSFAENKQKVELANSCPYRELESSKYHNEESKLFCRWLTSYLVVKESLVLEKDALLASQKSALKNEDGKSGDAPDSETKDDATRSSFAKTFLGTVEDKEVKKVVKRAGLDAVAPAPVEKEMLARGMKVDESKAEESTPPKKESDSKAPRPSDVVSNNTGNNSYAANRRMRDGDDSSITYSTYQSISQQNSRDAQVHQEFAKRLNAMIESAKGGDQEGLADLIEYTKANSDQLLDINETLLGQLEKVLKDNGKSSAGIVPTSKIIANKGTPKKASPTSFVPGNPMAKGYLAEGNGSSLENTNSANGGYVASNGNKEINGSEYSPYEDYEKIGSYEQANKDKAAAVSGKSTSKSGASRGPASSGSSKSGSGANRNVVITNLVDDQEFENEIYVKVESFSELSEPEVNEIKAELEKGEPFIYAQYINGSKVQFNVIPTGGTYKVSLAADNEIKGDFVQYIKQIEEELAELREHKAETMNNELLKLTQKQKR